MSPILHLSLQDRPACRTATPAGPLPCTALPAQTAAGPDGSATHRTAAAEAHAPTLLR